MDTIYSCENIVKILGIGYFCASMKKYLYIIVFLLVVALYGVTQEDKAKEVYTKVFAEPLYIPSIQSSLDQDGDGIDDFTDIVQSARAQIGVVTEYDTSYYSEAYPPANKGACADIMWRALENVGYDFKTMLDKDMKN